MYFFLEHMLKSTPGVGWCFFLLIFGKFLVFSLNFSKIVHFSAVLWHLNFFLNFQHSPIKMVNIHSLAKTLQLVHFTAFRHIFSDCNMFRSKCPKTCFLVAKTTDFRTFFVKIGGTQGHNRKVHSVLFWVLGEMGGVQSQFRNVHQNRHMFQKKVHWPPLYLNQELYKLFWDFIF